MCIKKRAGLFDETVILAIRIGVDCLLLVIGSFFLIEVISKSFNPIKVIFTYIFHIIVWFKNYKRYIMVNTKLNHKILPTISL